MKPGGHLTILQVHIGTVDWCIIQVEPIPEVQVHLRIIIYPTLENTFKFDFQP